jgi:heme a synthase
MIPSKSHYLILLRRLSVLTLWAVYFLILVGGIVRSTGSGMGCPDWPKCFGQWVPPTDVTELPADYKDQYSNLRHEKNIRFANYLSALGMNDLGNRILGDESIREEADFNAAKTWTEYINRLIGAIIGLLIVATFLASIPTLKESKRYFLLSLLILVLVLFQGWIGSVVVSTNLLPWMVTLHMFLALLLVALLIYLAFVAGGFQFSTGLKDPASLLKVLLVACMATMLVQIALGTQVREALNHLAASLNYQGREGWIDQLGISFLVHRSFSLLIGGLHAGVLYLLWKQGKAGVYRQWALGLASIVGVTLGSGAIMAYFAIPAFAQPVHLLLATLGFGFQFMLWLVLINEESTRPAFT